MKDMKPVVRRAATADIPELEVLWSSWIAAKRGTRGFNELYGGQAESVEWLRLLERHTALVVEEDGSVSGVAVLFSAGSAGDVVELQPFAFETEAGALLLLEAATTTARDSGALRIEYSALAGDRLFKSVGEETGFKGAYVQLSHPLT
jgi:hypothetical protein